LAVFAAACGEQAGPPPEAGLSTAVPSATEEAMVGEGVATAVPDRSANLTILADGVIKVGRPVLALSFQTSGRLLDLAVQPGDVVAEGQLLGTLDDASLQDAITSAELRVTQAQLSLAQAQADLEKLVTWEPDANAVAVAEANLVSAEASLERAETQDGAAGNSLTAVNIQVTQAQRGVDDAQTAYNTAFDPAREWELNDPWRSELMKAERDRATRGLQSAQEQLQIARSNWALEASRLNRDSAVSAEVSVLTAQQELARATTGPTDAELATAELAVERAELTLEQEQFALQQAQNNLAQAQLVAPWAGVVLSVEGVQGGMVGAGSPVLTLLDNTQLEFHTTNVSERDLAQIVPGQTAVVTLKSYPNEPFTGVVQRIGVQAEGTVGDAAVFPVVIRLDAAELPIRPGMTGRVEIAREN
jgi:multidrug efflux pump subunit AcrA (membrane-fusion protein)